MSQHLARIEYDNSVTSSSSGKAWVDGALQRVLGAPLAELRRIGTPEDMSNEDRGRLLAQLNRTFERRRDLVTGTVTYLYRPRGSLALAPTPGSRLASLAHRAQFILADALKALDGVEPLVPTANPTLLAAQKEIVRNEVTALVQELAGEATAAHISALFDALLVLEDGGHLAYLRELAGLDERNVNTAADERVLVHFFVLNDHLQCLRRDWGNCREDLRLGEQVEIITRGIACTQRTLEELYDALGEQGLGKDCLEAVDASFNTSGKKEEPQALTFSGTLRYLDSETRRWPALVESGGRLGVFAIREFVNLGFERLDDLLQDTVSKTVKGRRAATEPQEILLPRRKEEEFTRTWMLLTRLREEFRQVRDAVADVTEGELPAVPADDAKGMA